MTEEDEAFEELERKQERSVYCCHSCFKASGGVMLDRMILCSECGNKRCPKASDHNFSCTGSNEPGQWGSIYTAPQPQQEFGDTSAAYMVGVQDGKSQREWVGLTLDEIDLLEELYAPPVHPDFVNDASHCLELIRHVEAKLKEKNT